MAYIDQFTNDILNGRTNLTRFNLQEHAGLCSADSVLIGAYTVACYARASLETSSDVATSQASPTNWEIDAKQEELVQQWAEKKGCWFPNFESLSISVFGPKIAQGAEDFNTIIYRNVAKNVVENVVENNTTLAAHFSVNERTIQRDLAVLQSEGFLRHIGPNKGGKWIILYS